MADQRLDPRNGPRALELRRAWRELQRIPNVGRATATDLVRLGVLDADQLARADPDELYERIGRLDGCVQDPCVRDVFAAAVAFARGDGARPWWHFTRERERADRR